MNDAALCPFSKPIIGNWCRCPHARLAERCSGKMTCTRADEFRDSCLSLVDLFKERSRFVLGLGSDDVALTHAQLMKIRCGGLLGMQRLLDPGADSPPAVRDVISAAESQYGSVSEFPFSGIVRDIRAFRHRKR
jgi:hypothetical protein